MDSANNGLRTPPTKRLQPYSPNDLYSKRLKRINTSEGKECNDTSFYTCASNEFEKKVMDHSDPFGLPNLLEDLDSGKYGSVTGEIKDLLARRARILKPDFLPYRLFDVDKNLREEVSEEIELATRSTHNIIDVEDELYANAVLPAADHTQTVGSVIILDSDDEDPGDQRHPRPFQEVVLQKPAGIFLMKDLVDRDCAQSHILKDRDVNRDETEIKKDKGVYVGVEDDMEMEEGNHQPDANYDGLGDIWKEMSIALECSKVSAMDPSHDDRMSESGEECDHSFILKDDIGYVCRICGVIQKGIETIIEYQFPKSTRTSRTYRFEARSSRDIEPTETLLDGTKLSENDFTVTHIFAHPRHRKQMKPHQVEGFNFLLNNLVTDNPGGCIMAHAPGSGKTFMIISFMQSFMAKYPFARPLVVLPKGILTIWKKEFQRWQVEDFPLYDFYSVKAENRSQQLEVLTKWAKKRSILFLGYKQFSTIVCDSDSSKTAVACREILLKHPSILILDEGHTPRNQDTDVLTSLEKVQTPRKVVLSGTLYQNHVKEVFNILNLVRPKFLRLDASKAIKKRILSRVPISRGSNLFKASDNEFYDLVEDTLLKDEDFKRKVTVIQDLREMTSKVLHYYKGDFLDELPGLVDFTVFLNLSQRQKREVAELRKLGKNFKISSDGSAIYVHPQLKSLSKNSATKERVDEVKIDEILEKLDEKEGVKANFFLNLLHLCDSGGEKLLVFSQYLLPLKFLERLTVKVKGWRLGKEIFVITGDSDNDSRETSMNTFNNSSNARVFFGSIRACGEGISLVGASRIIILDVHLNPSITRQAIGRAFRPGQERKVHVYRLVAAGSPEQDDHSTCFKKESISKMWFEWNEYCGHQDFAIETVDAKNCGDMFLETPWLNEDIVALHKR